MISRQERERQLIDSGMFNSIKTIFINNNVYISDKYLMLITDYVDSLGQLDYEQQGLYLDPIKIARALPRMLKSVREKELDIYGITDNYTITMNSKDDYETNKLFFFHELTHAIQTRFINNHEECSFYNGDTGMFLTEGATQFIAEILYHVSNGTNLNYREQSNSVRGLNNHIPYSALSQYQLNGNIILLLSYSLGIPLNQILALGYRSDGREQLKKLFEVFPGNEGKFEEFMFDLEKIYSIDKLLVMGYRKQMMSNTPIIIELMNGKRSFFVYIQVENDLINKVERELIANFIANNDEEYIISNYQKVAMYLTTQELKTNFNNAIQEIIKMRNQSVI